MNLVSAGLCYTGFFQFTDDSCLCKAQVSTGFGFNIGLWLILLWFAQDSTLCKVQLTQKSLFMNGVFRFWFTHDSGLCRVWFTQEFGLNWVGVDMFSVYIRTWFILGLCYTGLCFIQGKVFTGIWFKQSLVYIRFRFTQEPSLYRVWFTQYWLFKF